MKLQTLLLLCVATLSCRAENSASSTSADRPAQKVESAKPAQNPAPAPATATTPAPSGTQAKAADAVAPADRAEEASKKTVVEKSESPSIMAAVVVSGNSDLKPTAMNLKMDLASALAGQQSAIAHQLADDSQNQKVAFARLMASEQPVLSAAKLPTLAAPVLAAGDTKNLGASSSSK